MNMKIAMQCLVISFLAVFLISVANADSTFRSAGGGIKIKDLQLGEGPAASPGQVATIHFIGWVDDNGARGRELYNTHREGQPVSFVIGTDGVMQGWNEGVLGMQPGGKRMLLVPPGMAYGDREVEGVVKANTALMFRFELVGLTDP